HWSVSHGHRRTFSCPPPVSFSCPLTALTKLPADGLPDGVAPTDLASLYTPQSKAWLRRRINQAMCSDSSSVYALWEPTGELDQWLHTAQAALP
ncbi:hypothetical protein, partial [Corynebacterium accolens]|uniref:hypothetical protein n=1 Tax=Corynebacterium accolens TaxID=38284 RepID=UPI00254CD128